MICNILVMFIIFFVLYVIFGVEVVFKVLDFVYVRCNRECIVERNVCFSDCCLWEEFFNRMEIMYCLIECNDEYVECEVECVCVFKCFSDFKVCISGCNIYFFKNWWDRC